MKNVVAAEIIDNGNFNIPVKNDLPFNFFYAISNAR